MKRFNLITPVLISLLMVSCVPPGALKKMGEDSSGASKILKSKDGGSQITIPASWKEDLALHDKAVLQASDRQNEVYVVVLADNKTDFDNITVEKYSELTRSAMMQGIASPQMGTPSSLTINGYPAIQCEIRGTVDNIKIAYLHVAAETPEHFYQILTWTLPSRFEKNRAQLEEVARSFKEIASASPSR
ncbi:MAG TPA: hypothetical protein VID27_13855 [Blastocatellia bacterium]|jgi:hypothetical protein